MLKKALLGLLVFVFTIPLQAENFSCGPNNVACLITSIQQANSNGQENDIFLDGGLYVLSAINNMTNGPNGLPSITGRMRIRGPAVNGAALTRQQDGPGFRAFHVAQSGNLVLEWLGISGFVSAPNPAQPFNGPQHGGAIYNIGSLTLHRSAIYGNTAPWNRSGGAIFTTGPIRLTFTDLFNNSTSSGEGGGIAIFGGAAVLEDTFITDNTAVSGGGISMRGGSATLLRVSLENNAAGGGGGITSGGVVWIESSSIYRNRATGGPGGVANLSNATTTIINSTVAENSGGAETGAGIHNDGRLTLRNATVAHNVGQRTRFAGLNNNGVAEIQNTILSDNVSVGNRNGDVPSNCNSATSLGHNLIGNISGCTLQSPPSGDPTDIIADPMLGPFERVFVNGVPVAGSGSYAPSDKSPAKDSGDVQTCPPNAQDGKPREGTCDIGAAKAKQP